ncbi:MULTISPECIES: hypothetical protein [Paenibacillus]|jgi:hypothetical protein|uniref:KTSC domain-containing protein n=1 Tax=Paenibacillus baimaensis TaxID=2982185 RepID=A0ABT2U8A4_9BACL|nr:MULTISPECIES: hypothetical protein [unclassified Paenibacillus]MCU6790848.1 hypothetical protein [Paenibacillus sp. WQ 127069]OMF18597.1 hypothetical protein BK127_09045 [Paenibacillus sp. FSL H7-0331]
MQHIPISSKQIAFIRYDDQAAQMHIQYHTGVTKVCEGIHQDQVQRLLLSGNSYDFIMELTRMPDEPAQQS